MNQTDIEQKVTKETKGGEPDRFFVFFVAFCSENSIESVMRDIHVAAAQLENRNGDKAYNLAAIDALTAKAVAQAAELVCCPDGA